MTLKPQTTYPNRRAYVLKVRGDATPAALAGRVENLVTGRQHAFETGRELVELIANDIEAGAVPCPGEPEDT